MIFDVPGKKLLLYGKISNVKYLDNELTAPLIEYDQSNKPGKSFYSKRQYRKCDLLIRHLTRVILKPKVIRIAFNMKTGKGITKGTYTQQGEMYVYGEKIKKVDKDVFYASRGKIYNL